MKRVSLFKWMVVLMMLPMGARAQFQTGNFCLEKDIQPVRSNHIVSNVTKINGKSDGILQTESYDMYMDNEALRAPRMAEEGDVTVTINLEYDANSFFVQDFYCLNVENNEPYYPESQEETSLVFRIPKGKYDFMVHFINDTRFYYVINEKVEVEDGMTMKISPDMAVNRLEVKYFAPNSERVKADVGYYDKDGNPIILNEGNMLYTSVENKLFLKGYGLCGYNVSGGIGVNMVSEEDESLSFGDIYVNDVSDRLFFVQNRKTIIDGENGNREYYFCKFSTDDVKSGVLENNPEDYVLCEEVFQITPYGKTQPGIGQVATFVDLYNNWYSSSYFTMHDFGWEKQSDEWTVRFYADMPDSPYYNNLKTVFCAAAGFHIEKTVQPWGEVEETIPFMEGSPFKIVDGKKEYMNMQWDSRMGIYSNPTNEWAFPGRPEFTYPATMKTGTYGDNCPINAFSVMNYYAPWMEQNVTSFRNVYVGRFSETRWCDRTMGQLKFNGEIIENPNEWQAEADGIYDITMVNTNIEVDGLQGKNTTIVHYDLAQEDNTPPTIEILQFKNADGMITDRFEKAEDGTMVFTAADINYFLNPETWSDGYDYQPLTVTVEYAPYDNDNWTEMQIEEVPELYNEDGWGYYYQASLKDVEGVGEKGWFDLRFTMADAAGNTHVQTVSPAFRIDDKVDTGIGDNNQYTITNNNAVYDLMGRKVGNGSRLLDNGYCNKGISIVRRANGDVRKVVIK